MSTMTERLALLVDLRSDDAIRGLNNLERNAARSLGNTEDGIDRVGQRMTGIGASMLGAGTLAAVGLVHATHATADLNEAVNLTGLIFGDARDEIDQLAQSSVDAVGLSERAYREATGQLGGLLQNLGFAQDETVNWSADLVQLAADMGSSFNRDPAMAVEALGSALRGESEPIRQFNVMLDDASVRARAVELGLADTTAEVDTHGLAQARLSLIMEQTARIQGDFANTSDGAANAQRRFQANLENFRAELGEQVLPIMEDVLGVGNRFLTWFGDLNDETNGGAGKVAAYGTAILLAGGAITTVTGKLLTMGDTISDVADSRLGNWVSDNRVALIGLTAVVAAATAAWQQHEAREAASEGRSNSYRDALRAQGDAVTNLQAALEPVIADTDILAEAMASTGATSADLASALINQGGEWDSLRDRLMESGVNFLALDLVLDKTQDEISEAREEAERLGPVIDDVGGSAGRARPQVDDLSRSVATTATPVADLRERFREATDGLRDWQSAVADWLANDLNYRDQLRQTNDAVAAYLEAEGDLADVFSDKSAAADDVVQAIDATAQAYADSRGAVDGSRESIDLQLESLQAMRAFIPAELLPTIDELIGRLGAIPNSIDVRIRTFEESSAAGPGQGPIRVTRRVGGPVPGAPDAPVPILAHGGEFVISRDVVEAIKSGSPTLGLGASGAGGGGGSATFVVPSGPTMSVDGFMAMVREAERIYGGTIPMRVERAAVAG